MSATAAATPMSVKTALVIPYMTGDVPRRTGFTPLSSRCRRRASKRDECSSAWNSSTTRGGVRGEDVLEHAHLAVVVERHVDVRAPETRLSESELHDGQRTSTPTESRLAPGASSVNEDGNTGLGCPSG